MHFKNTNKVKMNPQAVWVAVLGLAADSYVRLQLSDGQPSVIQRLLLQLYSGLEVRPQTRYL